MCVIPEIMLVIREIDTIDAIVEMSAKNFSHVYDHIDHKTYGSRCAGVVYRTRPSAVFLPRQDNRSVAGHD
jgi:hypothetical protein